MIVLFSVRSRSANVKTNVRFCNRLGGMPRVSQDYLDARRTQILDAARRCFLRDGFHATSMQDLFAESGLSSGAVYRYFGSKDEVILAIAEENMAVVTALVREAAVKPDVRVTAAIADVLALLQERHQDFQLGGIAVLVWSEVLRNPSLGQRFRQMLDDLRADLGALVKNDGWSTTSEGVDAIAAALLSMIVGYIWQLALFGSPSTATTATGVQTLLAAAEPSR
jgi:AcrR family transcriptional regulator